MINQPLRDIGIGHGVALFGIALYLASQTIFGYIGGYMPFRFSRVYRSHEPKKFRWLAYTYIVFTLASCAGSILVFIFN